MAQTLEGLERGDYVGATKVAIRGLSSFPLAVLSLASTLEVLDLSSSPSLSSLPEEIAQLEKLKVLFLSDCSFTSYPIELAQCKKLEMVAFKGNGLKEVAEESFPVGCLVRWLILTNNSLTALPSSIGNLTRLQKCMLAGNSLTSLPNSMSKCKKLGLLRLSSNALPVLPPWLLALPELTFLSVAGNPFLPTPTVEEEAASTGLQEVEWTDLELGKVLGQGASGVISLASWRRTEQAGSSKEVAVKVFKGAVTSDGSPLDEMRASIAAGAHAHLIDPLGRIVAHPEGREGLVLELIPPVYTNLGGPPTLESCTRDSFPSGFALSPSQVLSILTGVASAVAHLHDRNVTHGDLYAHNILVDLDTGKPLLGDFGAASLIAGLSEAERAGLKSLEVGAMGWLIQDMAGLLPTDHKDLKEKLAAVEGRCTAGEVGQRPTAGQVVELLSAL